MSLQLIKQVAGQWAVALPQAEHPVGRWFRSIVAERLMEEGIRTLGELVALVYRRGSQWWRSVSRAGAGRARVLVAWLRRHADTPTRSACRSPSTSTSTRSIRWWRRCHESIVGRNRERWPTQTTRERGCPVRERYDL
ncbi:phage integrase family protein [Burkholderia ubonensis]|uniref:phage integrase family protein n=1 Tax=Burkholderia ubonensis TaxID=101571 RepID=UPI002FC37A6E